MSIILKGYDSRPHSSTSMRDMRRDLFQEAEAEVPHADAHGGGHEGQ